MNEIVPNNSDNKPKYPMTFNVMIEESINTIYFLEDKSYFKQDISSLNQSNFEENGIVVVNEDFLRIENSLFIQTLELNMIKTFTFDENIWEIELKNNEVIKLTFDENTPNLEIISSSLKYKLINREEILYRVPCQIVLNKNLLLTLGNLCTFKQDMNFKEGYNSIEFGEIEVLNSYLNIFTNVYEIKLPYTRLKKVNQKNQTLELYFHDNSMIILKNIPYDAYGKVFGILSNNISNSPEYNDNTQPVYHSNNQLTNYNNQTPQINQQQPSYNQQFSNQQYRQPLNKKSKIIGLLLNIILVGLGYAYVGKWGEGFVLLILYILLVLFGLILSFIGIGVLLLVFAFALWIYSLFKTNEMIDKYNAGVPY